MFWVRVWVRVWVRCSVLQHCTPGCVGMCSVAIWLVCLGCLLSGLQMPYWMCWGNCPPHHNGETTMGWQSDLIRHIGYTETDTDPKNCICGGGGWWLSTFDTWVKCGAHLGPHPEGDYCEGCHGYDCWRPRGYHLHPVPRLDGPLECSPYFRIRWVWDEYRERFLSS